MRMTLCTAMILLVIAGCVKPAQDKAVCQDALPSAEKGMLTVVTFNIRYGTASDGLNSWEYRKDNVFALLAGYRADIDPVVGGRYTIWLPAAPAGPGPPLSVSGTVFSIDKPRLFHVGNAETSSQLELIFRLLPTLDGTGLTVTHNFAADIARAGSPHGHRPDRAWQGALEALRIAINW